MNGSVKKCASPTQCCHFIFLNHSNPPFFFFNFSTYRFWRGMYGRFESGVHPRESMNDHLLASQDHTNSLEDHVHHLTKRIGYLKNLISKSARRLHNNVSKPKSNESDISNDNRQAIHLIAAILNGCFSTVGFSILDLNMTKKWVNCRVLMKIIHWNRLNWHHQNQIMTVGTLKVRLHQLNRTFIR